MCCLLSSYLLDHYISMITLLLCVFYFSVYVFHTSLTFLLWQKGGVIRKWSNFDSYSQLPWKYCLHSNQYKLLFLVELFSCFSGTLKSTKLESDSEVSIDISIGIRLWRSRRCYLNIGLRLRRKISEKIYSSAKESN